VLGFAGEATLGTNLLTSISNLMTDFAQMYRYARIKRCTLELRSENGTQPPFGGAVLSWIPRETTAAPTDYTSSEGLFQVPIVLEPTGNQVKNKLTLNTKNITGLVGNEGWITTSSSGDVGIDEYFANYGAIYLLSVQNFNAGDWILCSLYVDMEFKTIYDPDVLLKHKSQTFEDLTEEEQLMILRHRKSSTPKKVEDAS
jgi:hypothetical protein